MNLVVPSYPYSKPYRNCSVIVILYNWHDHSISREVRLLYEEGETNALDKMYIGTITAHELAHKWFGNLITCRWWDNVWINEGFASYFEYFAMDGVSIIKIEITFSYSNIGQKTLKLRQESY